MTNIQITTKTPAEISAAFKAVLKGRTPAAKAKRTTPTLAERLAPYRKAVLQAREAGFNWKEIAAAMADPRIGEKVTGRKLNKLFGAAAAGASDGSERIILDPATGQPIPASSPAARALAAAAAAQPPVRRVVLDPLTGEEITPPGLNQPPPAPPPVPPMTPKEHAAWDETLKQLIPTIVNTAMPRKDAWNYTDRVVEMMKPAEAQRFHAIVEAELEAMTETTCAKYGIAPEAYGKWHRRWVRG